VDVKNIIQEIFTAALNAVIAPVITREHAQWIHTYCSENNLKNLIVIGFGKASCQMAVSLENVLTPGFVSSGILITKYGHAQLENETGGKMNKNGIHFKNMMVFEAGHPIPDENGLKASESVIKLLNNLDHHTLVVCLISGGGSALLVYPYPGISLQDKQKVTELLLKAGADINELNAVRKHISMIKGGRFAELAYPAKVVAFIISDVIGDRLDVIASGPTSPDSSTFQDALNVIEKYQLKEKIPEHAMDILKKGRRGVIPETPKFDNSIFKNVTNIIVANNQKALESAKVQAQSLGYMTEITKKDISGEARQAGTLLAKKALKAWNSLNAERDGKKICMISGGETTVTVTGNGKGGRNTELALSFAREIQGIEGITLLSAGTDGTDGPTDAAGAIVNGKTIARARAKGLDPEAYLENNDSYSFFKKIDSLLVTGPTGTNVMDIQIILII
jgi:hydroxypyruvate reductase/glycerate 2-kinase